MSLFGSLDCVVGTYCTMSQKPQQNKALHMGCSVLCRELVPTADINLVASLMQLLYSLLDEWRAADVAQSPVSASQHYDQRA